MGIEQPQNFYKPKFEKEKIGELNRLVIESIVDDWIEKYPLREGNLGITDPNDEKQVHRWVDGVLGRIKHQLLDSGFPMDRNEMEKEMVASLHRNLSDDPWYFDYLIKHLPSAR